jgi:hypothetical protein
MRNTTAPASKSALKVKTHQGRRQNSLKNENTPGPPSNPAYRKGARGGASHLTRGDPAQRGGVARTNDDHPQSIKKTHPQFLVSQ